MYFAMSELDGELRSRLLHSTIIPRPIAWISSRTEDGRVNLAPFSFFNLMSGDPPLLCVCIGSHNGRLKDTARNIAASGEFVVNLVSHASIERMNITAIDFEPDIDESVEAGVEMASSHQVGVPRIAESPASYECKVRHSFEIDQCRLLVVADIIGAHIDDKAIVDRERMYLDPMTMDLVARLHNPGWYTRLGDPFMLLTPSLQQWRDARAARDTSLGNRRQG